MLRRTLHLLSLLLVFAANATAQDKLPASAWGNTPPLHVEGKYLCDPYGNKVVLHGVMDTPSCWFNDARWGWMSYDDSNAPKKCREYFHKVFEALTDSAQGAFCNLFRLHLDPAWTGNNSVKAKGFKDVNGKHYDPHGNEVGGEADIYHFDKARLKKFLRTVYVPLALDAIQHGMYVIMRPPGVFPGYVEVGDYYNDYIMTVWDIVTQNDSVKKYSGQISIELGNEPVTLKAKGGANSEKALCDFFQPVVDKIRDNGFDGIVWGVGTGWQGNYRDYGKYPLVGKNIGYAVHNYVGWYGGDDNKVYSTADKQKYANEVHNSWPIMDTNPIVITEVDWSPKGNGGGHYNEHGNWVDGNFGTWATGSTSRWGAAYRYMLDKYDNVSMTLSGTHCLIDIDDYVGCDLYVNAETNDTIHVPVSRRDRNDVLKTVTSKHKKVGRLTNVVNPAFAAMMRKNNLDPMEASGAACMAWYKDWAKVNYARPDLLSLDAPLTEMTSVMEGVTCMVGQSVDFGFEGKFGDGLTSKIPAWMCNVTGNDESVCTMLDGRFVAVGEGSATMKAAFAGNGGEALARDCKVEVLPAFSLDEAVVNPSIMGKGSYATRRGTMRTAPGGLGGWEFDAGIDLSDYNYLVIELYGKANCSPVVCVSDSHSPSAAFYTQEMKSASLAIDLKTMQKPDGTPVDAANIHVVAIKTDGSRDFYIKNVFLSNDGTTPVEAKPAVGIQSFEAAGAQVVAEEYYNAAGQCIAKPQHGINIVRQTLSNGSKVSTKIIVR